MATRPTTRTRLIGTPLDRATLREVRPGRPGEPPPTTLLLGEYLAAVRREFESVALIAASEDPAVPQLQIADVEIELVYGVEEVTDAGMRVAIAQARLAEMPEALIHRVRMRLVDPTVRALPVADKAD
jgi:hypothetical protein